MQEELLAKRLKRLHPSWRLEGKSLITVGEFSQENISGRIEDAVKEFFPGRQLGVRFLEPPAYGIRIIAYGEDSSLIAKIAEALKNEGALE